ETPSTPANSGNFRGLLSKPFFARERRYSRKVSWRTALLASRRALYVSTNYCRTDGVTWSHLRYLAISSECRSPTGIIFQPTQSARLPCAGFHVATSQVSFNPAPTSCG